MGASESTFSTTRGPDDEITTVSEKSEIVDPILQRLKSLEIATPILTSAPEESSLTDILVRKASSSQNSSTINPNVLLELFSMYRDWQEKKARDISRRQEEVENKIEVAEALAVKLLGRFNHSVSAMKATSQNLSEVDALQVELGELKGRLTEVISNCDALCKRISTEGPESLRSSVKPFTSSSSSTDLGTSNILPSVEATNKPFTSSSSSTDLATHTTGPSSELNTNEVEL